MGCRSLRAATLILAFALLLAAAPALADFVCSDKASAATVGTTVCWCGKAVKDSRIITDTATLTCPAGHAISGIKFANVGTASGACGKLAPGSCSGDPATAMAAVKAMCPLGKSSCVVTADLVHFNNGADPCYG